MKQAAAKTTQPVSGESLFGVGAIALTFLDTTWRIATPMVLFTVLGIVADLSFGTKPWLTLLIGVPLGGMFAVLLVKNQLQQIEKMESKKK
jgi:hypothetical protein